MDAEPRSSFTDVISSLALATLVAGGSALLAMFAVLVFSFTSLSWKWFGDEGSAWLPISIGIPVSGVTFLAVFVIFVRKFLRKRRSNSNILSGKAVATITALPYREDAEWQVNILPFGSIYWVDEMPPLTDLFEKPEDMLLVNSMFGLRIKLWDGEALDALEQQRWDAVKAQVPEWALFKRLTLSKQQTLARQEAERQVEQEFQSLADNDAESSS
jgi:hypothetical protein